MSGSHHGDDGHMPPMIGPYRPIAPLGEGGMARVYRAVHPQRPDVVVAIKQILSRHAVDAKFRASFAREMEATSEFSHLNIVCTEDYGHDQDGTPYMVMELIDGVDLRTFQRAHPGRRLPEDWVVLIAINIANALEYVHDTRRAGGPALLHRDISPHNILLTPKGRAKLADFGIAKAIDSEGAAAVTVGGGIPGKMQYMSPEQAVGEDLDARTDLYALGLVLYELLVGEPVFSGPQTKMFPKVLQAERPPLAEVAPPGVRQELLDIIEGLLQRDRNDRTPDASTLLRQLKPLRPPYLTKLALGGAVSEYKNRDPRLAATAERLAASKRTSAPEMTMEVGPGDILTAVPSRGRAAIPVEDTSTDAPTRPRLAPSAMPSLQPQEAPPQAKRTVKPRLVISVAAAVALLVAGVGTFAATRSTSATELPGHLEGAASSITPEPVASAPRPTPPSDALPSAASAPTSADAPAPAASPSAAVPDPRTTDALAAAPAPDAPRAPDAPPPTPESPAAGSVLPEVPPVAADRTDRPRTSAPAAPGTVRVVVLPWGNVWVDGARHGEAPQTLSLRPGRHTIAVGQGSQTQRRTVTVRSGTTDTVRFDLRE